MLLTLIALLLLISLLSGGVFYSRWGYGGFSPFAVLVIVALVLYLTGHLRFR